MGGKDKKEMFEKTMEYVFYKRMIILIHGMLPWARMMAPYGEGPLSYAKRTLDEMKKRDGAAAAVAQALLLTELYAPDRMSGMASKINATAEEADSRHVFVVVKTHESMGVAKTRVFQKGESLRRYLRMEGVEEESLEKEVIVLGDYVYVISEEIAG